MEQGQGTLQVHAPAGASRRGQIAVIFFAAAVFLAGMVSPPGLMDDVDAVQAQIARNMLESGDWVTARLDGVPYLEKAPLKYWMIAFSYMLFGVHDWPPAWDCSCLPGC
jgi:4-amino-4-deoxy-L-arabinose transferase-like glycosyltransferase